MLFNNTITGRLKRWLSFHGQLAALFFNYIPLLKNDVSAWPRNPLALSFPLTVLSAIIYVFFFPLLGEKERRVFVQLFPMLWDRLFSFWAHINVYFCARNCMLVKQWNSLKAQCRIISVFCHEKKTNDFFSRGRSGYRKPHYKIQDTSC